MREIKRRESKYLIRWRDYEFAHDDWRNFSELDDAQNLIVDYETTRLIDEKQQQQQAEATRMTIVKTFVCRRCKTHFSNKIKLHCHVRERHVKKSVLTIHFSKFFAVILITSSSTFSSKFSTVALAISSTKFFVISANISTSSSIFSTKFFAITLITFSSNFSSSISLYHSCLINYITRSFFISVSKSYFTMHDLYNMFHEKLHKKSMRQTRIISYFKSINHDVVKLISMRKHDDFNSRCLSTWIHDLRFDSSKRFDIEFFCFLSLISTIQAHDKSLFVKQVNLIVVVDFDDSTSHRFFEYFSKIFETQFNNRRYAQHHRLSAFADDNDIELNISIDMTLNI